MDVEDIEKKRTHGELKKALDAWGRIEEYEKKSFDSQDKKIEKKNRFIEAYDSMREEYESCHTQEERDADDIYQKFIVLKNAHENVAGGEVEVKLTDKVPEDKADKTEIPENTTLSSNQKAGIKQISQWFLRNCTKKGANWWKDSSIVNWVFDFVLKKPDCVKLMAFFMIEKGLEKIETREQIRQYVSDSQTEYVPNLENFKKQVVTTKWKFWQRLSAENFRWDKVRHAICTAEEYIKLIPGIGNSGGQQEVSKQQNESESEETTEEASEENDEENLIRVLGSCLEANETYENKIKEADKDSVSESTTGRLEDDTLLEPKGCAEMKERLNSELHGAVTMAISIAGLAGANGKLVADSVGTSSSKMMEKARNELLGSMDAFQNTIRIGGAFSLAGAVLNIVNQIIDLIHMIEGWGEMPGWAKVQAATEQLSNASATIVQGTTAIYEIAEGASASASAVKSVAETAGRISDIGGMATGGISAAVGLTKVISANVTLSHAIKAKEKIDKSGENNKILRNIGNLALQHAENDLLDGTVQSILGAASMLCYAIPGAAIAGTILSFVSTGYNLAAGKIHHWGNVTKIIDDYINTDEIYTKLDYDLKNEMDHASEEERVNVQKRIALFHKSERKIKNEIRIIAYTMKGYYDEEGFFLYITEKYACDLYMGLFFPDWHVGSAEPNGVEPKGVEPKKKIEDMSEAYLQTLYSLGLKPNVKEYSKEGNEKTYKIKPTINDIAAKMRK